MSSSVNTKVIQVTNVAPTATKEQMKTLFSYIGRIEEVKLYPAEDSPLPVASRVCFVKYEDSVSAGVACHLTNTVFIDRALILVPVEDGKIPDESHAMQLAAPGGTVAGVLPTASNWPSNVVNQVTGTGVGQVIMTHDPRLTSMGLPQYPPLPATMDASKIDEIRRTVYIDNLDSAVTGDMLMQFFAQVGEVKYIRMAGDDREKSAYVEFTNQTSVPTAFTFNGVNCGTKPIKVSHSTVAIIKPMPKIEIPSKEVEEAMKKVKEAQSLISGAVESGMKESINKPMKPEYRHDRRPQSRSPIRGGRRKRSRSRSRRSRSRSRKRSSSRSRRSRSRKRSRSRGRRSRSRSRRSRSRSKRSPRRRRSRSRSRNRGQHAKPKSNHRRRSKTPPRGYRSSRRSRTPSRERSRKRSTSRGRKKSPSPYSRKKKAMSRSPSPPVLEKESLSPSKRSRSRSRTPKLTKKPKRSKSRSPRRRSRSRDRKRGGSRSRHVKKEKKRDRDRSRERSSKKKDSKINIQRDYDEEEKGYSSENDDKKGARAARRNEEVKEETLDETKDNLETEDMDMDSD
ncbi:serine/arginine-rich splicing factor 11-like isoform X2 [Lineus longissimus]|uniref:serine/arginine-rich splicing factor 11-like isoform X2 n=1 Tax=Lineus longissimus TaxID=88925 RepID=UPI002B4D50BF